MSRHLSDRNIKAICGMLDGWRGTLTWDSLVAGIEGLLGERYSRQALNSHDQIRLAFQVRKNILKVHPERPSRGSSENRAAQDRITRLEAENARLHAENDRLLGLFAIWAYNASLHGLDKDRLNRPMPSTNRDRTKISRLK